MRVFRNSWVRILKAPLGKGFIIEYKFEHQRAIFVRMLGVAVTCKSLVYTGKQVRGCEWHGVEKGVQIRDRHYRAFFQRKLWRFCQAFLEDLSQNNNTVANEWCSAATHRLFTDQLARAAQDGKLALEKDSRLLGWLTAHGECPQMKKDTQHSHTNKDATFKNSCLKRTAEKKSSLLLSESLHSPNSTQVPAVNTDKQTMPFQLPHAD